MATKEQFIDYICGEITDVGDIRYKKMFGEYMIYINDKPIIIVCDNTPYIKKLPEIEELMKNESLGIPYEGSKDHYILDIDNKDLTREVLIKLEEITPLPKPRKKKN